MKINENDFKKLPQGKEFVAILEKMFALKEGESPFPLYEELLKLVSMTVAFDSVPVLFPYLVALAMESRDFTFVNFVGNLKLGFYHRGDLKKLSPANLREYLGGLHNMRTRLPLVGIQNIAEMGKEFTSLYFWNAFTLYSYSHDVVALSKRGQFTSAFKVECAHCGNDIHSLYIDGKNPEKTETIVPAEKPEPWDGLFCDDLYAPMVAVTENLQEEYFSKILPYVFGTYRCSICEKENNVMEAMARYAATEQPCFVPTLEYLKQLELLTLQLMIPEEKWEFCKFLVGQYRNLEGKHSPNALLVILQITQGMRQGFAPDMHRKLLAHCEKELSFVPENTPILWRIYQLFATTWEFHGDLEKAEDYFQKAFDFADSTIGLDSVEALALYEAKAFYQSRRLTENQEAPLLEHEAKLLKDPEKHATRLHIFHMALVGVYEKQEKYPEAIEVQKKLLERVAGKEAEGDFLGKLGDLLAKAGQEKEAQEALEQSLACHLKSLNIKGEKGKLSKKEKPKAIQKVISACRCHYRMAEIAFEGGDYALAVTNTERALELWDWGVNLSDGFLADIYYLLGHSQWKMGKSKGKPNVEKALSLYQGQGKSPNPPKILLEKLAKAQGLLDQMK
ncbi:MAG: tetratricopeptide repeat protein [Eubacteriales bacterium]